jgi:PAS domain S-box-containing protein
MMILLIEDNPADAEMIGELLSNHKKSSFSIINADRLSAAKPYFTDSGIDIILLDLGLPDSQGLDTLRHVREHAGEVPIVVLTMLDNEETGLDALKEGAQDYLVKGQMSGPLIARSLRYAIERGSIEKELKRDLAERKQIERTLKLSNERFRISALSISDLIWDWNIHDGRLDWYGKTDALQGYAPGEFPRTIDAWEKIIHPDDRDQVKSLLDRHVKTQIPYAVEYRVVRKDGEIRYWTSQGTAMLDENGIAYRMVGSCNDITERKLAEVERARLVAIEELSNDAIITKTLDGRILSWNAGAERIYGYSAQEIIGKSISLLVPPDHPDDTGLILERIIKGEKVIRYETQRRKKDGGLINITLTASPMRDAQNSLIGVNTIAHDITWRKISEETLRASENRYRRLFETAQDGILILDAESGQIVDVNPFLINMLGFSREEFLGKKIWEIGLFKDIVANKDHFGKLQQNEYIRYEDMPLETAEGLHIAVEFVSNVYTVNNKKVIQCNIRDITERKTAEDALALASRKLNLLSSITRHDINNQLQSLNGFLEILHEEVVDPAFEKFFSRIENASTCISTMIRFTKEYEQIGVNAPIWQDCRTLIDTATKEAPLGQIIMDNDVPAGTEVFADPLIVKIFYNLMDNAVRHGGKITTIRFSVERRGDDKIIVCKDDGNGVLADEKERIFNRGFGKNTGLGLALAREILDITGITIHETGEPGKGARFEIVVPNRVSR